MPIDPSNPVLSSSEKVRTGEQLWSDNVGMAEASDALPERDVQYEFTNGRKFVVPRQ